MLLLTPFHGLKHGQLSDTMRLNYYLKKSSIKTLAAVNLLGIDYGSALLFWQFKISNLVEPPKRSSASSFF